MRISTDYKWIVNNVWELLHDDGEQSKTKDSNVINLTDVATEISPSAVL